MQKHADLTLKRISLFAERRLPQLLYTSKAPVRLSVFSAPGRIPYDEAVKGSYVPANVGEKFGPLWSTHWFQVDIEIPEAWAGKEVHFLWDSCSEGMIWEDGKALQGLTGSGGSWSPEIVRGEFVLAQKARGGETRTLFVEIAINNLFGISDDPIFQAFVGMLRQAEIALFDREAWDLMWDFTVVGDMAKELGPNTPRGAQAMFAANQMINTIHLEDRETWKQARKIAQEFFSQKTGEGQLNLSAVGHAHIDTAWLWPLDETRRKCIRTFSTALRYMDEYPDYKFACSQAQQYEWIKEMNPDLWGQIKQKVKEGRFIPSGGSWVEPDCNIPSGEALVRQFLYGQRFFQKEFGITCQEFWEPDVFGYSAALPQILRQVGIKYFLTIKLSWNQFNKLSSHTFLWEGLDGSQVLTHFPPADTYNSMANVQEVLYSQKNYKDLDRSREAYLLFGYGDGGGGPTLGMLEQLSRMGNVDGLPRVEMRTPGEFFQRLEKDIQEPTVWVGELYFELHRGTYTTQARNKLYNRQSENLLHEVEFLSAVAHACKGYDYPTVELDRIWKMVLTNQFHDIIPGSSIRLVYEDSDNHYQNVLGTAAGLRNQAAVALLGMPATQVANVCALNTVGVERSEVVELPEGSSGVQTSAKGKPLGVASAPSYGYAIFNPTQSIAQKVSITDGNDVVLENEFVRATFTRGGSLTSLFDKKAGREAIEPGKKANAFVLFDDDPNAWDAWDVDIFHLEKPYPVADAGSCRVIESGPLRASAAFEWQISPTSVVRQVVSLTAISARLDFETEVDWQEDNKFLKVEFPLNLRAPQATYEIQFGHLQRPTHFNTSWDMARFEVMAHKWADVSEPDFGVSLLNDCKYGHAVHGNILRLSLLRAPHYPDPIADRGSHAFRYALLTHEGSVQTSGVIEEGFRFNVPMQIFATSAQPEQRSFFSVNNASVMIDTVKKAEDSDDLIVRMYEARGMRGEAVLQSTLPVRSAARCNLLEEESGNVELSDGGAAFSFKPFEIITLKLKL
jgi:alpha-mannosidase